MGAEKLAARPLPEAAARRDPGRCFSHLAAKAAAGSLKPSPGRSAAAEIAPAALSAAVLPPGRHKTAPTGRSSGKTRRRLG